MSGKILIIRFSAFGDVAMTIPVIYSFACQYPEIEITILSRKNFAGLFQNLPANVHFMGIDLKKYDGLSGLNNLYKLLKAETFDYVADFHDVLRTKYLRSRFILNGVKVAHIDKGRGEKEKLTRKKNKVLKPLKTSFERYQQVLNTLGFAFNSGFRSIYENNPPNTAVIEQKLNIKKDRKWLGIAPFAKHEGKIYPPELMEKVIEYFSKKEDTEVFIFGGGVEEKKIADSWLQKYSSIHSLIGELNMEEELTMISMLDVMLSMDSANMHLASLVATPVVSVWGATHPYAGFLGWKQKPENAVQVDLYCRPCSIFGQKPCYRGDYACMHQIEPTEIIKKINLVGGRE